MKLKLDEISTQELRMYILAHREDMEALDAYPCLRFVECELPDVI